MSQKTFRLKPEVLNYLEARQAEWHQESLTDTLHKLVLEHKRLSERAAEPAISTEAELSETTANLDAPTKLAQQPSHPSRSYLKDGSGPETLAYLKEKARQKARTEAMLDRKKQIEEFRKQAIADRHEQEYYYWQRKQKEKEKAQGQHGSSRIEGTQDHSIFTDNDWGAEA